MSGWTEADRCVRLWSATGAAAIGVVFVVVGLAGVVADRRVPIRFAKLTLTSRLSSRPDFISRYFNNLAPAGLRRGCWERPEPGICIPCWHSPTS